MSRQCLWISFLGHVVLKAEFSVETPKDETTLHWQAPGEVSEVKDCWNLLVITVGL